MKLTLRGVEYQSDLMGLYELSLGEARQIKRRTGMTISDWRVGLMTFTREDPDVLASLVYLLRHRARQPADPEVDWAEIDQVGIKELVEGFEWEDADTDLVNRVQEESDAKFDEVKELLDSEPAETQEPEPEPPEPDAQDTEQQGPATT